MAEAAIMAASGGLVIGCQLSPTAGIAARPIVVADTSLFAAVARAIADSSERPSFIDPRPFRGQPAVDYPQSESLEPVPPDSIVARTRILRALNIPTADATLPANCAGVMAPPSANHTGCPRSRKVVNAVGVPRSESDAAPPGLKDYEAVRVMETNLGPSGYSVENFDYIFAKRNGRWSLAARKGRTVIE